MTRYRAANGPVKNAVVKLVALAVSTLWMAVTATHGVAQAASATGPARPVAPRVPPFGAFSEKTTTRLTVAWIDRSHAEAGFVIYRRQGQGEWAAIARLGSLEGGDFIERGEYRDENLIPGRYYCYRVEAHNEYGASPSTVTCTSTNRVTSDGVVIVNDRPGLTTELTEADAGDHIYVEDDAEIQLPGIDPLPLKPGVTLASGRAGLTEGALIFTKNDEARPLIAILGGGARITGLRIMGPDLDIADKRQAIGIQIALRRFAETPNVQDPVEIDHSEIFGWSRAAIEVSDTDHDPCEDLEHETPDHRDLCWRNPQTEYDCGSINLSNAGAVHIHNNYIHHNQHKCCAGYGVVVGDGAYALIERNVFDFNRHAIAGDGRAGTGYLAHRNLVLRNGGRHRWGHTHQFDMHGRGHCGLHEIGCTLKEWGTLGILDGCGAYNCGVAGEVIDIRKNTFQYRAGPAIKLRGTPRSWDTADERPGAFVTENVFAGKGGRKRSWRCVWLCKTHRTVKRPRGGLHEWKNLFGIDTSDENGEGDFDGDGVLDLFQATGVTWWFSSGGRMEWRYLNTMPERLVVLRLEDVDGNGRTDVLTEDDDGWLVSYDGISRWRRFAGVSRVGPGTTAVERLKRREQGSRGEGLRRGVRP